MVYQPKAAGDINSFNGLPKTKLESKDKSSYIAQELMKCIHEQNIRPRLNRESLIQEAIKYSIDIDYIMEQDKILIRHYKFIHRNKKVYRLKAPEVVTQGQENTIWIIQGKANLKLSRLEDIT